MSISFLQDSQLSEKFSIEGIPSLVLLDAKSGEVLQGDAYSKVEDHPNGEGFPWKA